MTGGVVAFACVAGLFTVFGTGRGPLPPVLVAGLGALGLAGLVAVVMAVSGYTAARRLRIGAALEARGLSVQFRPDKRQRAGCFARFAHLTSLRRGERGVRMWAGGEVDGRHVDLIEHAYVVSTGKSSHTVYHCAAATACPAAWPSLTLSPGNVVTSWWASLRGQDMTLENEAFNERWIVKAESEDFALLVLTPRVQEFLAHGPSGESWQIGDGAVCWVRRRQVKPETVCEPLDRLMGLMALIPPELEHWEARGA